MKRYLATILVYDEINKSQLENYISNKNTIFFNSVEYTTAKEAHDAILKEYNEALESKEKIDFTKIEETLENVTIALNLVLKNKPKEIIEDSIEICPQIGERGLFIENYREVDILEKQVIQLDKPFYVDDGKEYISVTEKNYKEFKLNDILKEKTDKYDIAEPIEIIEIKQ